MKFKGFLTTVVSFFAALIGFGLKHLLDIESGHDLFEYKNLCFLIAAFLYLRFLTGSVSQLWVDHLFEEKRSIFLFYFDILTLILIGVFATFMSYAENLNEFILLGAILIGTAILWSGLHIFIQKVIVKIQSRASWGKVWIPLNIFHESMFCLALWYSLRWTLMNEQPRA
ncbi:hypothetical protein [Desulfospira joergensenii]|uniref:hypothetical protein n=1 Tax=Desulfospira joergensenii TaxID=53329 RepID=UPI0003B4617A|nr:hypothetical protein [Desulfospira joergensenii]